MYIETKVPGDYKKNHEPNLIEKWLFSTFHKYFYNKCLLVLL